MRLLRRHRSRGQALVEVAIALPVLLILIAGAAQVGSISYSQVTVDTAAREGARAAVENPETSMPFFSTGGPTTYTCSGSDSNKICSAVREGAGLLDGSQFTVTITSNASLSLLAPGGVVLTSHYVALSCTSLSGTVNAANVGQGVDINVYGTIGGTKQAVTVKWNGNQSANQSYKLCLTGAQTIIAETSSNACGPGVYRDQGNWDGSSETGPTLTPVLVPCPTPTPSPTPTPTPSASPTPTPTPSPTPGSTPTPGPGGTCTNTVQGTYVTVDVKYLTPIFVPLVDMFFSNPPGSGHRTVDASVTMRVEPCAITQGN